MDQNGNDGKPAYVKPSPVSSTPTPGGWGFQAPTQARATVPPHKSQHHITKYKRPKQKQVAPTPGISLTNARSETVTEVDEDYSSWIKNFTPVEEDNIMEPSLDSSNEGDLDSSLFITSARAWMLVEHFNEIVKLFSSTGPHESDFLQLVHLEDMIEMMERFLETQQLFRSAGKPWEVDIGYHYTTPDNMGSIRTVGLLSQPERHERGITSSRFNGRVYGNGIYTGNNPGDHFGRYGNVGLLVLRIKGNIGWKHERGANTTVNHKGPFCNVVVLRESSQCVPIIQFDAAMIDRRNPTCTAAGVLYQLHQMVEQAVDSILNDKKLDPVLDATLPVTPQSMLGPQDVVPPACLGTIHYSMWDHVENLTPVGNMPYGSMTTIVDSLRPCPGHSWGLIQITYIFPKGRMESFHPNPGQEYAATIRQAYLPNSRDGRVLLSRLQEAFRLGLTFSIGTSQTTGRHNQIVWSLPHKSTLTGGAYGFPDPNYIATCNMVLDKLGVKPGGSDALLN